MKVYSTATPPATSMFANMGEMLDNLDDTLEVYETMVDGLMSTFGSIDEDVEKFGTWLRHLISIGSQIHRDSRYIYYTKPQGE